MYSVSRLYRRCGSRIERLLLRQVLEFQVSAPCLWQDAQEIQGYPLHRLQQGIRNLERCRMIEARSLATGLNLYVLSAALKQKITGANAADCQIPPAKLIKLFAIQAIIKRRYCDYQPVKSSHFSELFGGKQTGLPDGFLVNISDRKAIFAFLDTDPMISLTRLAQKIRSTVRRLATSELTRNLVKEGRLDFVIVSSTCLRLNAVLLLLRSYSDMRGVPFVAITIPELWTVVAPSSGISSDLLFFLWARPLRKRSISRSE